MAKPDTDDGWLKYAHELDAALAVADFTKGARIVLREVFAQIFGPAKLKIANISPTRIAERVGAKREQIARGLRELTDAGVLIRHDEGAFRFVKDYETWVQADGRRPSTNLPRLSPAEVSYCRHAPAVALAYVHGLGESERHHPVPARNQIDTECLTNRADLVTNRNQIDTECLTNRADLVTEDEGSPRARINLVTQNVTKLIRAGSAPPDPPIRNARAEFKTGDLIQKTEERATTEDPVSGSAPKEATPFRADLGTTSGLISGPGSTSPEAIALEAWALSLGCDRNGESYASWARQACDFAPVAWIRVLLEKRVKLRTDRIGLPYLSKILSNWLKAGACEWLKDEDTVSGPAPSDWKPPTDEDRAYTDLLYSKAKARAKNKDPRP